MSDAFSVNHSSYGDVNAGLVSSVARMDSIMEDLNAVLRNIGQANQSKATPIWIDHQNAWNRAYTEMKMQLNGHTQSSLNVAQIFQEGDDSGVRVMM
jgi:predicted metal-dependent phosphotriesterase family hydrolase